jgi:hypothetical protein
MKLWKIIPHSWMTRPCAGPPKCSDPSPHSADATFWFRLAYGGAR